jgi:hypothetical protein
MPEGDDGLMQRWSKLVHERVNFIFNARASYPLKSNKKLRTD